MNLAKQSALYAAVQSLIEDEDPAPNGKHIVIAAAVIDPELKTVIIDYFHAENKDESQGN